MKKRKWIVIMLSVVPGLSLLYLGRVRKALPILVVDIGIVVGAVLTGSYLFRLMLINIYIFTFLAPFMESYQIVEKGKNSIDSSSKWYVSVLLLTTGFNALPLLWQSENFTRKAKIAWSVVVPVLFAVFVMFLVRYWEQGEMFLRELVRGVMG